ncbi:MAG: sigma-54 dependent transcriptional regulator [Clostridium sp.]|nr:sigma-54 dependent transcriptional regulator [Prevotella sp.]MCM1428542.1 sigma-54 dependent transcriptional regulator [Clostridium sp.]MCM1475006.1 sigma-54 dependent transcriptional regulator [Muribaculaceae bacterium]
MPVSVSEEALRAKQRFSIIGNSPALAAAITRAVTVAPIDLSVLVTGESGSGKEFFPKIIHFFGARKHKKYIAVNCGAIPEGTIDSELFGHEKGSFTGAVASRKGYFEEADGGTIFLDEVAELPLTTQARLLRVLETGEFLKVGSSTVQKTDIRIVAATNVDLIKAVEKGKFREDLYYRLSTILINVPPLRDRGDDILLLARKFAADFSEKYMTAPISFSEGARHALSIYSWPGNVRQLKNVVEQLALFEAGKEISRSDVIDTLPSAHREGAAGHALPSCTDSHSYDSERELIWQSLFSIRAEIEELRNMILRPATSLKAIDVSDSDAITRQAPLPRSSSLVAIPKPPTTLEDSERSAIALALSRHDGNKRAAADDLGISIRTLYRKIREFGLEPSGKSDD